MTRSIRAQTHLTTDSDLLAAVATHASKGAIPYNLLVQTRSNLNLKLSTGDTAVKPGGSLKLVTSLQQYSIPLPGRNRATAWQIQTDCATSGPDVHRAQLHAQVESPQIQTAAPQHC